MNEEGLKVEQTICITDMLPRFTFASDEAQKKWDLKVLHSQNGRPLMVVTVAANLASTAEYGLAGVDQQSLKLGIASSGFRDLSFGAQFEVVRILFEVWMYGEHLRRWWNIHQSILQAPWYFRLMPWHCKRRGDEANKRPKFIINPAVHVK